MIDYTKFEGHTPGPWEVSERNRSIVICKKGTKIALAHYKADLPSETHPNTALIAAAPALPDLLAENKRLREQVEKHEAKMFVTADGVRVWPGDTVWHRTHIGRNKYIPDPRPAPNRPFKPSYDHTNDYFSTEQACADDILAKYPQGKETTND